jgi:hypothetical protein
MRHRGLLVGTVNGGVTFGAGLIPDKFRLSGTARSPRMGTILRLKHYADEHQEQ